MEALLRHNRSTCSQEFLAYALGAWFRPLNCGVSTIWPQHHAEPVTQPRQARRGGLGLTQRRAAGDEPSAQLCSLALSSCLRI
jgi:hypothetical protein